MSAKKTFSSKLPFVVFCTAMFAVVVGAGQTASAQVEGIVTDWSTRHLVFSNPGTEADAKKNGTYAQWLKVTNNPRYLMQEKRRSASATVPTTITADTPETSDVTAEEKFSVTTGAATNGGGTPTGNVKRDWSVSLGSGYVAANQYPATFSTVWDTPVVGPANENNCNTDFAVFGLDVAGSGTQANLVAIDNLYSGTTGAVCGTTPTVKWAYNVSTIAGSVTTSPVLSLDGTLLAFVESSGTASVLHILRWKDANGTVTAPVTPSTASTANCTAPCMVSVPFGSGPTTVSAPFYDYLGSDTAYVGNDNGKLFSISGVFQGTPAVVTTGGWSASGTTLGLTTNKLTGPVLDYASYNLYIGGSNGNLYAVNSATGALVGSALAIGSGSTGGGMVSPPLVDSR